MMNKIFNLGITKELSPYLKGKVILTNQLAFILFCVGSVFGVLTLTFLPIALLSAIGVVLCIGVLVFNNFKYYNASRILVVLMPTTILSLIQANIVQTNDPIITSLSIGYIAIAIIPFLVFDVREKKMMLFSVIIVWCIFMFQDLTNQWIKTPMDSSMFYNPFMVIVINLINICIITFGLIFFQLKNYQSEKVNTDLISKLQVKKEKLTSQKDVILKQNEAITTANERLEEKVKERTIELREKNELLNNYFDNLPGVVYSGKVDGSFRPSFVSKGSINVIGLAAEELSNKGLFNKSFIEPSFVDEIINLSKKAQQNQDFPSNYEFTYPIKTEVGNKWILDKGKFTKDADGELNYNGIWLDVTDKVEAENSLKERDQQLKYLLESSEDMITLHDEAGTYLYYNGPKCYNIKPHEIIGKTPFDFFNQESAKSIIDSLKKVFRTGESIMFENRLDWLGSRKWFSEYIYPVRDQEGNIKCVAKICRDIESQKIAEQRVKESEEKLSLVYNNVNVYMGLFEVKNDGSFILESINKPFLELFQLGNASITDKELIGIDLVKYYKILANFDNNKIEERVALFKQIVKDKKNKTYEGVTNLKNTDTSFYFSSKLTPVLNQEGDCTHILFVSEDITKQKKAELELQASEAHSKTLFEHSPIIIWEEDFSAVKSYFNTLTKKEITELDAYFEQFPDELNRLAELIKVKNVNQKSIEFYEMESKEKHITESPIYFVEESWEVFKAELIALAKGASTFESEIPIKNRKGELLYLIIKLSIPPEYQDTWESVIVSFIDITDRKKARKELEYRLNFESLLTKISTKFINLPLHDLNRGINNTLKQICEFIGFDRAFLVLFSYEQNNGSIHNEWFKPRLDSIKEKYQNIPYDDFPWFTNKLKNNELIIVKTLDEIPEVAIALKKDLINRKIQSQIHVPLTMQDKVIGFIGYDALKPIEEWPKDLEVLLRFSGIMITNVLQRIKGEKALKDSEEQLAMIYNNTNEFIGLFRVENGNSFYIESLNKTTIEAIKMILPEFDPRQLIGMELAFFYKTIARYDDELINKRIKDFKQLVKSKKEIHYQGIVPIPFKGNKFFAFEANFIPIVNPKGDCNFVLFVTQDITERKIVENAIKASEQRLSQIYNNNIDYIGLIKVGGNDKFQIESVNRSVIEFLNKASGSKGSIDIIGMDVEIILKKYLNFSEENIEERIAIVKQVIDKRERIIFKNQMVSPMDGQMLVFETVFSPILESEQCVQVLFVIKDITEKEMAKESLISGEKRMSSVFNGTKDNMAIFDIRKDGKIVLEQVNQSFIEVSNKAGLKLNLKKLYGKDIHFFNRAILKLNKEKAKNLNKQLQQVIKNKKVYNFEEEYFALNNNKYYLDVTLSPILSDDGSNCDKLLFVARDITFKKKSKEQLISKILETEDRERKRISKDLHDSLGQNLTTASLNLNFLKSAITQIDDSYKIKFQKGIKFLNNAIDESRNIAHNLMPQSIVDFGYVMTIESLIEDLSGTTDVIFVFYNNLLNVRLPPYQELSLFRITQEAINNILKHSEATKATFQLMKYPDAILLTIEDNGKGFEIEKSSGNSFGLDNMRTRVSALSGSIDINSSPGRGTSITIEIPA